MCPVPLGIEGGMWDVIVLIPDHCLSIYFTLSYKDESYPSTTITFFKINQISPVGGYMPMKYNGVCSFFMLKIN